MDTKRPDPLNILVVDDNEDDFVIVRDLLREADAGRFNVDWVQTYEEGVAAIRAKRHDLILLDFRLSSRDGIEILEETRSVVPRPPVILLAGQGDYDIDVKAMRAGAVDYIVKDLLSSNVLERSIRYAIEREKWAEELRTSEDRYRTFVDNSTEGIWRLELEEPMPTQLSENQQIAHLNQFAYVAECNATAFRMYGFDKASDIVGLRFNEFLSVSELGDDNYCRKLIRNNYCLVNAESIVLSRHRQITYVLQNLTGVVSNGHLYRIWGSLNDNTLRKQSQTAQAQLAAIVESSHDAIFSKTLDSLIVTWNRAAENLYGFTAQEVIGKPTSLFKHDDQIEEMHRVQERVGKGEHIPQFETVHRHKDGRLLDVSLAVSPIINHAGEVTGSSSIVCDISKQKHANALRKQAEEERDRFFTMSLDMLCIASMDGYLKRLNPIWSKTLGYSEAELLSTPFLDLVHPEDRTSITAEVGRLSQGVAMPHFEARTRCKDGSYRWIHWNSAPDPDTGLFYCVGRDVTERKLAEEVLVLHDEAIQASINGIVITDLRKPDMPIVFVNSAFERITGYSSSDVLGKNCRFLQGQDRDQPGVDRIRSAVTAGEPVSVILQNYRKDGTAFWNELFLSPIYDAQGNLTHYVGILNDVTDRKWADEELLRSRSDLEVAHSELKQRVQELESARQTISEDAEELQRYIIRSDQLLATIPSILIGIDQSGEIDLWNNGARLAFGKASQDVLGKDFRNSNIPWDWGQMLCALENCTATRKTARLDNIRYTKTDGKDGLLGITLNPISGSMDEPMGILISAADISERRLLETQLMQAQKLESIGQLAAGIAHEINTPMQYVGDNVSFLKDAFADIDTLLSRYSDILKSDENAEAIVCSLRAASEKEDIGDLLSEVPNAISDTEDGIERVVEIVQAMRAFSHPGTDQKTVVNLNQALGSAVTVSRNEWKYVADVVTNFDEGLPPVPCLPGELNQVFLNMIINASHAIGDVVGDGANAKGTITISTQSDGEWVEVRISDTGTGIPEEIRSKIFDPFFTTKAVGRGTGQGLAISHSVIKEKHSGMISVESEVGKGSTFVIRLPLNVDSETQEADIES